MAGCSRPSGSSSRRTGAATGRARAASATFCKACSSAGGAATPITARRSACRPRRASRAPTPTTAAAAATPTASAASACARTRRCARTGSTRRSGTRSSGCCGTRPGSRPSTNDASTRRGNDGPELDVVEARIAKLRRAMARLIDGYADGLIDKAEFEPRITGLRQRIKGWEEQAASLRDEAALRGTLSLIVGRFEDFAQRVRGRMAEVDWSLQRDLIRTLVKRVEIDHDGINVVFRVAPSPSDSGPPDPDGKRTWQGCGWSDDPTLRCTAESLVKLPVLKVAGF